MPELQAFYEKYRNEDVILLTINIMQNETVEGIRDFMNEGEYSMPVAIDMGSNVTRSYGIRGIPTTFFIDADGYVKYQYPGPLAVDILERYLQKLNTRS